MSDDNLTPNEERAELIDQLREALHRAESPDEEIVEFEIGDTAFCFEF